MSIRNKIITVEIAYATAKKQAILTLHLDQDSTLELAILKSGILQLFPDINLAKQKVGIFSQQKSLTDMVKNGDRIEIYRDLTANPNETRKKRAKKGLQ